MKAKRGIALAAAAFVLSPLALGLGVVVLIAIDDDSGGGADFSLAAGSLRVGKGFVPAEYAALIEQAAADCDAGLPAAVLAAQIMQESGFNPKAQSKDPATGKPIADGIAQIIPSTWAKDGVDGNGDGKRDVWDPEDAILTQGQIMCKLLKSAKKHPEYNGSPIELALAGYNAGWGRVQQYKGVPPQSFAKGQTYNYVKAIMANVEKLTAPDTSGTPVTSGGWGRPVKGKVGTPYHQQGGAWSSGYHTGIDFVVPTGTSVHSIGPGKVVAAGSGGAYGNQIVIRHPDGMYSQYAHLSKVRVSIGDVVSGGQAIGLSGSTGNSFGPHLHFEIRTGPDYGTDVSPLPYLRKKGIDI
ncbi:peptidoglycan DD-metalloendopeptidase family protein [Streptomyces sp.]|uniref:peptidoglycan DD-metalloendopeptidase family protein n=1 Tax=Streptomyces sp. TaxID=1931 RepID=UPI0028125D06|nr:peptidoglycan DD-metalloendopeptidase family protein [Streptomyces sp.]